MLRFLSNTHDPKDKNARMYVARRFDETQEEAWRNHLAWLKGKVIGEPQATEAYTVAQLKEMGMVGVYAQQNMHLTSGSLRGLWASFWLRASSALKHFTSPPTGR